MSNLKLFESKKIRSHWDAEQEKWYFSIVDIIEVFTGTDRPGKYWADLKAKLKREGSELAERIGQLKMGAEDGKMRETDIADTEQLFRLIQSIPRRLQNLLNNRWQKQATKEWKIARTLKKQLTGRWKII